MEMKIGLSGIRSVGPGGMPMVARTLDEKKIVTTLYKILRALELCSLATVTHENAAHCATVYYAFNPNVEFCFLSDPDSLHCKNLETNRSMSVSVYDSKQKWGSDKGDRGLVLYGECREARGEEVREVEKIYAKRFKEYAQWKSSTEYSKGEGRKWRFFKFVPSRLKLFDERKFGSGVFIVATIKR